MTKEMKKSKEKQKENNYKFLFVLTILVIAIIIIGFIIANQNNNSIKGQIDKILNSNQLEVIFFERKENSKSDEFKELLDTDLKEQGVTYTTIDITNATHEELEYLKLKLNISSEENFNYYIIAINGSENLFYIDYSSIDRTMFIFANKGLLKDNQEILNEYHYNLGKQAFENGILGTAKEHLEQVVDYKDEKEILSKKRFYLVDNDFEYDYNDVRLSFSYLGGYKDDTITVSYQDCRTLASCFDSRVQQWDALMKSDNKIMIKDKNSNDDDSYDSYLNIEIISENKIKLGFNGSTYTLTKK